MPIMSVKEFEKRTSVGLLSGKKYDAIVDCLKDYHKNPSLANLKELKAALTRWQWGHSTIGVADSWQQDRRNQVRGMGHPIEDLTNSVDRKLVEPALLALRDAASDVLTAYGDMMDHLYRGSMMQMFMGNPMDSVEPMYCFYYWEDTGRWQQRLNAIGAPNKTNAFCMAMNTAQKHPSIPGSALVRIKSDAAPANRQIEFGLNPDHHSLAHELLHWCTHQVFEDYTHGLADKTLGKFIREGLTEWLTRNGLSEWDKGGYIDFFPIWKELIDNGDVTIKDIIMPYFHGVGVSTFCTRVQPLIEQNEGYKTGRKMEEFVKGLQALSAKV